LYCNVGVYIYYSFSDEAGDAISGDVSLLSAGYVLVIVYITIMLGKFNCLEQRVSGKTSR
jgi:hypothetical protein